MTTTTTLLPLSANAGVLYALAVFLFRYSAGEILRRDEVVWLVISLAVHVAVLVMGMVNASPDYSAVHIGVLMIQVCTSYKVWATNVRGSLPGQDMDGLNHAVVIITGANSGIGLETAKRMASKGCHVIMACRNIESATKELEIVKHCSPHNPATVELMRLDLNSLASVREFVDNVNLHLKRVDILINNAGCMIPRRQVTVDGFETMLQVNFLAPFLLTFLLTANLAQAQIPGGARVVNVSSSTTAWLSGFDFIDPQGKQTYEMFQRYAMSKYGLNAAMLGLAPCVASYGISITMAMPGSVITNISRNVHPLAATGHQLLLAIPINKNVWAGSNTTIHAACSQEMAGITGVFVEHCGMSQPTNVDTNERCDVFQFAMKLTGGQGSTASKKKGGGNKGRSQSPVL